MHGMHDEPGVTVFHPSGSIDLPSAMRLREQLDGPVGAGSDCVLVDLSRVRMVDSAGISVLVQANTTATRGGRRFAVAAPQEPVQRVLQMTGAAGLLDVHETVDQACAAWSA